MMQDHQRELQRFQRDIDYFRAHQQELLDRYPGHWVAIFNEHLGGANPNFDALLADLQKRGIPMEKAFVEHVTRHEDVLILPS